MGTLSGKPQMLKEVNSSMIERLVFDNGPLSKPELAKRTGLSLTTISKLVDGLEKKARLSPVGLTGKGAGRRAMLYETNRNSGCLVACYYQEESFFCRIADMLNNTLFEKRFPLDLSSFKKAINSTLTTIDFLIGKAPAQVKIIGVGLPGVVQPDGCLLGIPQIAVWEGFNLQNVLTNRYKKAAIYVENGVKCSAVGYFNAHLKEKYDKLVYFYVGNGIGSGIILDRQLYRGAENFSGEIGYMTEPRSMTRGDYASSGGYMESLMSDLVDYSTGELRQKKRIKDVIAILSTIAVNHVAVLNPDVIVFAGKIFDDSLIGAISKQMANYLPAGIMPKITLDTSSTTGLDGLIRNSRSYITTGMHLVQSNGLLQQAARIA
ncbi:MAG: ROK family transcriptional regulator [Treponema sp.]|nr:ROK family transcriptional regulator [Treponema sp.]